MKSSIFIALLAVVTLAFVVADAVEAATPTSLSIFLRRRAQPSGPATYDIQLLGGSTDQSVTSPGGHVFSGFLSTFAGLTESQALAESIGQWTIARPPLTPPNQAPESHTLTVAPFSLSSFYTVPPEILSPANNSTVPPSFPLVFAWPPGESPPTNRAAHSTSSNQIASAHLGLSVSSNIASIDVTFKPGETQGTLQIAVGTIDSMDSYLSDVTSSAPNPYWDYSASMMFQNLSQSRSLTVTSVPEPASLALMAAAAACTTAFGRRRR